VDRRELPAHTAVVFQDFIQYALSAGDNIALGRHERAGDTAAIVQAAERAGADKDIAGLPEAPYVGWSRRVSVIMQWPP
jgi:ATP-binding cassette subfamily B protein